MNSTTAATASAAVGDTPPVAARVPPVMSTGCAPAPGLYTAVPRRLVPHVHQTPADSAERLRRVDVKPSAPRPSTPAAATPPPTIGSITGLSA